MLFQGIHYMELKAVIPSFSIAYATHGIHYMELKVCDS